jgi:hypothetical protein
VLYRCVVEQLEHDECGDVKEVEDHWKRHVVQIIKCSSKCISLCWMMALSIAFSEMISGLNLDFVTLLSIVVALKHSAIMGAL